MPFIQGDVRRCDVLYKLFGVEASLVPKRIYQRIEVGKDNRID
jgi:hypothetical protein